MSILQFLRIFWARRLIVMICAVASFLGALVVIQLVQPRYEASARVLLNNVVRPDPVTGEMMGSRAGAFFDSQIEMIKDYGVTGRVVDQSGWLSDPGKIAAYAGRPKTDTRDFRRWLAQGVADDTVAAVSGTVLTITYRSAAPSVARLGAEVLRQAYLDASLTDRRTEAARNAAFYEKQADNARQAAEAAEMTKAQYEKSSGIIMSGSNSDLDSERLASLASQTTMGGTSSASSQGAAPVADAAVQLAQLDVQMAELSKRLGPNHPAILDMKARRAALAPIAAKQAAAATALASGQVGAAALARALQDQKAKVIGQREQVERLRQLQSEADLRREQYRTAAAKAAQYATEATVSDVGMTPLGVVLTPRKPVFPNKQLMAIGSVGLGLGLGLALSLLLELLNRRVRGVEDLSLSSEIHCIGVVEQPRRTTLLTRVMRIILGWAPEPRGSGA
jgi:succinoglycan biosynthesis transport protein ExoP